jgi:putative methyltransferase (TIGR04325 family)
MNKSVKGAIKQITPPLVIKLGKQLVGERYGYFGDYASFQEAANQCGTGYRSPEVVKKNIEQTCEARARAELVIDSRAIRVLSALQHVALALGKGELRVLDFGGALGALYFRLLPFMPSNVALDWTVVETDLLATAGKENFASRSLSFCTDLDKAPDPDIVIASCSLQYVPEPYRVLGKLLEKKPRFVLFDRTPVIQAIADRITIQIVPPEIFTLKCPARFFSKAVFLDWCTKAGMQLRMEWSVPEDMVRLDGGEPFAYSGYLFERNETK